MKISSLAKVLLVAAVLLLNENGQQVQGKSLLESYNHELYLKGSMSKVGNIWRNTYKDMEHEGFYRFVVWSVTKYKSFMRGISEGFYDNPEQFEN